MRDREEACTMPFIDLPPPLQERVICSISAAVKYEVPANIVLAVAEKEAGKPGQWMKNTNGTHDVGPMQFNTLYLGDLAKYGITANDAAASGCYSFDLAAWRLRQHLRKDKQGCPIKNCSSKSVADCRFPSPLFCAGPLCQRP